MTELALLAWHHGGDALYGNPPHRPISKMQGSARVVIESLSKEESLEKCLRLIQAQSNLPAFSHHMAEVGKAMGDESTTLNLLTNLILKNVSLTASVLRAANSVQYNLRGKPILSVSRAVTMMGWDAIRNRAAGVMVFEHFRNQSEKLKELVLLMMLTANHARQIAIRSGLRVIEEAYLCGMFRNLGELVVACYLPGEYERIQEAIGRGDSESQACERELKFRYQDAGKEIARRWNLPEAVSSCMDNPDMPAAGSDLERLRIISSFSHALSTIVYRNDDSNRRSALQALMKRYESLLSLKVSEIPAILEAAVFETEDTFRVARVPFDRASLRKRILAATGEPAEASCDHEQPAPAAEDRADVLTNLMKELRTLFDSSEEFELNATLMMILEAFYRGAGLDRVLFCLVNAGRTHVQARLGVGADIDPLIDKFRFPISIRSGPIASALLGKEDVILDGGAGVRYSRSIFTHVAGAPCFGILPLIVDGIAIGCLYFDSASEGFAIDARIRQTLSELRNFAVQAVTRKRLPGR